MGSRWRHRPFGGVRWRTAGAATVVVAIVLVGGAFAFVGLQGRQLEASLTSVAAQQAADVADQVSRQGASVDLITGGGDQSLVQVINSAGVVVSASPSIDGEPPVSRLTPGVGTSEVVITDRLPVGEGEKFVVVARTIASPDGVMVVLSAQSLESVQESTSVVTDLLVLGLPIILFVVALTSFWLAGRALAPVEAIRRRVATIDGAKDLAARVPVPGGNDEITRLADTMNSMLERLESSAHAQRRFVGDASHELRSPLAMIRAAHEIQSLYPHSTDWPSVSEEVLHELDRVDRLVADMLLLARADESGLRLQGGDVDLDDLVHAEAARIRRTNSVAVMVTAPPVRVIGDEHHISRALRNLAENAARHARHQVALELKMVAGKAEITVTDDGPGIDPRHHEKVFRRFVRLDESRARAHGGTGLGLPIAREIAVAHGGELRLETWSGGSRFVLSLPLCARPPTH